MNKLALPHFPVKYHSWKFLLQKIFMSYGCSLEDLRDNLSVTHAQHKFQDICLKWVLPGK